MVINVIKRFGEVNKCHSCYLLIVSCPVADVQDIYKCVGCRATLHCFKLIIIEFTGDLIKHPATDKCLKYLPQGWR